MISLRRSLPTLTLLAATFALAACSDRSDITQPTRAGAANHDGKVGSTGNSAKSGGISARVLLDKAGHAVLEIYTGTFDDATNTQGANGYFDKIQYKIYRNGSQVDVENVNLSGTPTVYRTPLAYTWDDSYAVSIQANLKNVNGDGNKTDVVRDSARTAFDPDMDLASGKIHQLVTGQDGNPFLADLGLTQTGVPQTFDTRFNNSGPNGAPGTVGAIALCMVTITNPDATGLNKLVVAPMTFTWAPNGRPSYAATTIIPGLSDTVSILPNDLAACRFTTTFSGTGRRVITVTAVPAYPADYDLSNNTVTGTITLTSAAVVTPPSVTAGGDGTNGQAFEYSWWNGITNGAFSNLAGVSNQTATISDLSSIVLTNSGITGGFSLTAHFYTTDGDPTNPTASRDLASATWSGDLASIVAAANAAADHCVASDTYDAGSWSVDYAKNNNVFTAAMCITQVADAHGDAALRFGVKLVWSNPKVAGDVPYFTNPFAASDGAVLYGDYLRFDTDLKFPGLSQESVSNSKMGLDEGNLGMASDVVPGGVAAPFNATYYWIHSK